MSVIALKYAFKEFSSLLCFVMTGKIRSSDKIGLDRSGIAEWLDQRLVIKILSVPRLNLAQALLQYTLGIYPHAHS